jgi:DNA-directed RNA polymerase subunit RPC12/RpoP
MTAKKRTLPGEAQRNSFGKIEFRKGIIIHASPRMQYVEMDDVRWPLVYLVGETFIYWCIRCEITVWETEATANRGYCPHCQAGLFIVGVGERVRLHYRYAPDKSWASWFAEKYDWKNQGLQDQ